MKKFLDSKLGQGVIEVSRWAVLAFVSVLLDGLINLFTTTDQTSTIVALTLVLRLIDSVLHKSGYAEKGLTRF